jgi:hypothetical protein
MAYRGGRVVPALAPVCNLRTHLPHSLQVLRPTDLDVGPRAQGERKSRCPRGDGNAASQQQLYGSDSCGSCDDYDCGGNADAGGRAGWADVVPDDEGCHARPVGAGAVHLHACGTAHEEGGRVTLHASILGGCGCRHLEGYLQAGA